MRFWGPGPKSGLERGGATVLLVALAACGADPPVVDSSRVDPPKAGLRKSTAGAASPAPAATVRTLALPVRASPPESAPRTRLAPVAAAGADAAFLASYPPQDECAKLPGFAEFRDALFAAVRKRDAAALTGLADPAVNLDFGGGSGIDEWRKRLEGTPALWGELAALESLGCAQDGGVVTLPWIFSRMPDSVDAYSAMLVTGEGVALLAKPAANSKDMAHLDWALVEAVGPPDQSAFREVISGPKAQGMVGFVETTRLRSMLDYRLIADRQHGEWKITAFVKGD